MDNIIVKKENKAKDLGIIVNNKLQWHDQIQSTVGKAKRRAFCLSRVRISKNVKTWKLLYKGYIRSILEYGLTAYCPYQKGQLAALEGVQRWMTRQVPGIGRLPYEQRRKICNLISIEDRLERGVVLELFKIQNNLSGVSNSRVTQITHNYSSRSISSQDVYIPFAKNDKRKNSLICRSASLWKNLPTEVKMCSTKVSFKIAYDLWKLSQVYE